MLTLNRICLDRRGVRLIAGLIFLLTVAACGGGGGGGNAQRNQTVAPTVSSAFPASDATGVATKTFVSATFSQSMDNATLTNTSFTLTETTGGAAITGTIGISGNSVTFTPSASLAVNTQFTATITTAAKDATGHALPANYTWNFTTGSTLQATSYTTNFVSTENPIAEGGIWINGKAVGFDWNDVQSEHGKAYASVVSGNPNRYNDSIAHLSTSVATFTPDQYAQGTVYRAAGYDPSPSKHEVELLLRFQIGTNNARGYEIMWGVTGYLAIVRWNGPLADYAPLLDTGDPGIGAPVDGDVLRAEIIGNQISVYKNNSPMPVATVSDSTYASGQPGMGFWPVDSSSIEKYGWKIYEAGNL